MTLLDRLDGELGDWLAACDRDVVRAYVDCRRADWMVRIAMAIGVDRRLVVAVAADAATLALRRTEQVDLRPARCVEMALRFARGEGGAPEAWAAGFAASQVARDLAETQPLASEAARSAAATGFACDPRADDHYYLQRAYAADAIEHAIRAHGTERAVGAQRCLHAVREKIGAEVIAQALSKE